MTPVRAGASSQSASASDRVRFRTEHCDEGWRQNPAGGGRNGSRRVHFVPSADKDLVVEQLASEPRRHVSPEPMPCGALGDRRKAGPVRACCSITGRNKSAPHVVLMSYQRILYI